MPEIFGRKVSLEVTTTGGDSFTLEELRIDFVIHDLQGQNRAEICIYNLNTETARVIGQVGTTVKLIVSQHGSYPRRLVDTFKINNSYTQKAVPNSITKIYGLGIMSFEVNEIPKSFTFKGLKFIELMRSLIEFVRPGTPVFFQGFTKAEENYKIRRRTYQVGKVEAVLKKLCAQHTCVMHSSDSSVTFVKHREGEIDSEILDGLSRGTGQDSAFPLGATTVKLQDNRMLAGAQIGYSHAKIASVLDSSISTGTIVDTSDLITATPDSNEQQLAINRDYLKSLTTGGTKFVVLSVKHEGSTHTKKWSSQIYATKISSGTVINPYNWY